MVLNKEGRKGWLLKRKLAVGNEDIHHWRHGILRLYVLSNEVRQK